MKSVYVVRRIDESPNGSSFYVWVFGDQERAIDFTNKLIDGMIDDLGDDAVFIDSYIPTRERRQTVFYYNIGKDVWHPSFTAHRDWDDAYFAISCVSQNLL